MPERRDDFELLKRWRRGDRQAGGRLIGCYHRLLFRFFQTKAEPEAEDLVQRTFLVCVERKDAIADLSSFRAYMLAIARTVLVDHYRRQGRHARHFDALETSVADLDPSPSVQAAQSQERRHLVEALRKIPLDLQVALELFYWEGLRGDELAHVLDLPEGTVRTRLRRGRQLLRERLDGISLPSELSTPKRRSPSA